MNSAKSCGLTSLMRASENGYQDAVKLLLDAGALVDVAKKDGLTSLISASQKGHTRWSRLC